MANQYCKAEHESVPVSETRTVEPESVLEILFENNPIAMWIFDVASHQIVAVNNAACVLYGYSQAEFLQKTAFDLRLGQDCGIFLDTIEGIQAEYKPDGSRTHITASGETIRILPFARRVTHQDRPCVMVWCVDVTSREQSSVELRSTQIFLDAVVESIPSMVFVKDAADGRFILLNKAGEELLGLSRQDLIGKTDFDLFDPEDAVRFRAADEAVVASGKLVTIENEPLATPEGIRSLRTQKVGVPDANGEPRYLLGISEDVTERLRAEARSRYLALHDVLTDLPNRLFFQNMLEEHLTSADEGRDDFCVLFLDLDGFKSVNDDLGHHAGDELVRQLASRMRMLRGADDVIARLGGDEFGILHCGGISDATASHLAQKLVAALSEPFDIDGHKVSVGCSIGIVSNSRHGNGGESLMKRADLALYAVKAIGKGGYAWFDFAMEEKADHERILRNELSAALENGQLQINYQPIVETRSGEVVCCEALLRWRHPVRGMISPGEFIPVAEASGLIEPIGRWVLHEACKEAARWPSTVRLAVNLSPRQFSGFGLAVDVMQALEQSGLAPERLELEITETVFLVDSEENVRLLKQLKELGIRIALDDFGTGYSSLAYLRRVAFDKLKIDQSFVSELTTSPESLAIVRAVIGLGKSFAATVTAEGVETPEQYMCLSDEGCDQAQGYLFGRPASSTDIRRLLDPGGLAYRHTARMAE